MTHVVAQNRCMVLRDIRQLRRSSVRRQAPARAGAVRACQPLARFLQFTGREQRLEFVPQHRGFHGDLAPAEIDQTLEAGGAGLEDEFLRRRHAAVEDDVARRNSTGRKPRPAQVS